MPAEPPTKLPATIADKPADSKFDRFHPEMPQIPGIANAQVRSEQLANTTAKRRRIQIGGMIAAVAVLGLSIHWLIKSTPRPAVESAASEPAVTETPVPDPITPVAEAHEGPTIAATIEELSKPWAAKKFTFVRPLTQENLEAMVIRLPSGDLWAFALQEPYGKCDLEFMTNLGQIEAKYGYRASHPMVVDSCNNTVYDPLKVGPLGGSTWVRGEIVQGGGLRPPISIDVQVKGRSVIADRIE